MKGENYGYGSRFGSFLEDIDEFDGSHFGISHGEANLIDPQHRILLETACEVIHQVGYDAIHSSKSAVYVGIQHMEYAALAAPHLRSIGPYSATSGSFSVAAGRISFAFGLKGPAVSIDTACSSAMVAVHNASFDLRTLQVPVSMAAGVNLILSESTSMATNAAGMLSPGGRCKALDAAADGYSRAEACVAVVLAPIMNTINVGDAVLWGTAVNQDGRSNSLTAPNGPAQESVINDAIKAACTSPTLIRMLQMHGTGTALGDPIEVGAALAALRPCRIRLDAAKSRVGHTEPVSGLVGLHHASIMIKQGMLNGNCQLRELNPLVASAIEGTFEQYKIAQCAAYRQPGGHFTDTSLTGISAFAFQGTNSHALIGDNDAWDGISSYGLSPRYNGTSWEKHRYWFAPQYHVLRNRALVPKNKGDIHVQLIFNRANTACLKDHMVLSKNLLPAAAMAEATLAALNHFTATGGTSALTKVTILKPLLLDSRSDNKIESLSLTLKGMTARICEGQPALAVVNFHCELCLVDETSRTLTENSWKPRKDVLQILNTSTGPSVCSRIIPSALKSQSHMYSIHPSVLDCATHSLSALWDSAPAKTTVPASIDAFSISPVSSSERSRYSSVAVPTSHSFGGVGSFKLFAQKENDRNGLIQNGMIVGMMFKSISSPVFHQTRRKQDFMSLTAQWEIDNLVNLELYRPLGTDFPSKSFHERSSCDWNLRAEAGESLSFSISETALSLHVQTSLAILQSVRATLADVSLKLSDSDNGITPAKCEGYITGADIGLLRVAALESLEGRYKSLRHDAFTFYDVKDFIECSSDVKYLNKTIQSRHMKPSVQSISRSNFLDGSPLRYAWVLTGGLGGIGQLVGCWAAEIGTQTLCLLGRNARVDGYVQNTSCRNECLLEVSSVDVARHDDLVMSLRHNLQTPIGFILHASAVIRDATIARQSVAFLNSVWGPKVDGARKLQSMALLNPVLRVLQFSSISAEFGNIGQANYAAANGALNSLAETCILQGIPTTSIMWGPWATGMAFRNLESAKRFSRAGLEHISAERGLDALHRAVVSKLPEPSLIVFTSTSEIDLDHEFSSHYGVPPRAIPNAARMGGEVYEDHEPQYNIPDLRDCAMESDGLAIDDGTLIRMQVHDHNETVRTLQSIISSLTSREASETEPLVSSLGIDSLMITEISESIQRRFALEIPATLLFDHPTIDAVARYILERSGQLIAYSTDPGIHGSETMPLIEHRSSRSEIEVRIASISCRYPGSDYGGDDGGEIWRNLCKAVNLQSFVPPSRWDMEKLYSPLESRDGRKFYAPYGNFVSDFDAFDAEVFRMSRWEAVCIDPQIRILLEECCTACLHVGLAGAPPRYYSSSATCETNSATGVFIGCMYFEYLSIVSSVYSKLPPQAVTGSGLPYMAGRLSYALGFSGPCLGTDTACSSSLVSFHLGHSALQRNECDSCVCAGTNLMIHPGTTAAICQLKALSPDGRSKTFDDNADGYGRGEGFAVMILTDNEKQYCNEEASASIVSSVINQSGSSSALTAPNGPSQAALIRKALHFGNLEPYSLSMMSIHGTGTSLGDPIEVGALGSIFGEKTLDLNSDMRLVTLLSNKSCLGHTEGAAGLSGLLTSIQGLSTFENAPIMHLRNMNPYVSSAVHDSRYHRAFKSFAAIPRERSMLIPLSQPLSGTSSFGMSGINAHVILRNSSDHFSFNSEKHAQVFWSRQLFNATGRAQAVINVVNMGRNNIDINLSCFLGTPRLAFLCDYDSSDYRMIPSCFFLELCGASLNTCIDNSSDESVIQVTSAIIMNSSRLVLDSLPELQLTCQIIRNEGSIKIFSGETMLLSSHSALASANGGITEEKTKSWPVLRSREASVTQAEDNATFAGIDAVNPRDGGFLIHPVIIECLIISNIDVGQLASVECISFRRNKMARKDNVRLHRHPTFGKVYADGILLNLVNPGYYMKDLNYLQQTNFEFEDLEYVLERQVGIPYSTRTNASSLVLLSQREINDPSSASGSILSILRQSERSLSGKRLHFFAQSSPRYDQCCPSQFSNESVVVPAILKNIIYELPLLQADVLYGDQNKFSSSTSTSSTGDACTLEISSDASSLQHQEFDGASIRSATVTQPLLIYKRKLLPFQQITSLQAESFQLSIRKGCLITGGLGGIGHLIAIWIASMDVSNITLLGRQGYMSTDANETLKSKSGKMDISRADLAYAEDGIGRTGAADSTREPTAVALHAAGVQAEGKLLAQSPKLMRKAMAPKLGALATWEMLSDSSPYEIGVLFSSVSNILGNPGHANYVAANSMLDSFAESKACSGRPIVSIQWGAWASVGMVQKRYKVTNRQSKSLGMLSADVGLSILRTLFSRVLIDCNVFAVVGAAPKSYWTNILKHSIKTYPIFSALDEEFSHYHIRKKNNRLRGVAKTDTNVSAAATEGNVDSKSPTEAVHNIVASIIDAVDLDIEKPLAEQGLDSLAGLELRQRLEEHFGIQLDTLVDPGGATVQHIAMELEKLNLSHSASHSSGAIQSLQAAKRRTAIDTSWIAPSPVTVRMRVFCLPWAGGISENLFSRWAVMMPASIQICPIEIPGRGRLKDKEPITTVEGLARILARSLPLKDKPYAIFGTCLGAIVGYELIREIERSGEAPLPKLFMPAAVSPPHVYASTVMKIYLQRKLSKCWMALDLRILEMFVPNIPMLKQIRAELLMRMTM